MENNFRNLLSFGQIGESLIARFLRGKGYLILPVYEKEIDNGKGPRLFLPFGSPETELIAPDMQAIKAQKIRWFEAKHKNAATYYRKKARWQTGIDKRHYLDYVRVQEVTHSPVWLLFLQREAPLTNAPIGVTPCPTGLFGCPITKSIADEGYYTRGQRRFDMVYWALEGANGLERLATLEDVLAISACTSVA